MIKPPTFIKRWRPGQHEIRAQDWNALVDFVEQLYHSTIYRGRNSQSWNPWVKIYNGSGIEIPASSMVVVSAYDADTDTYTVGRPGANNLDVTMVTGDVAIAAASTGLAHPYGPVKVKVDDDGEAEAPVGNYVGTQVDDFEPLLGNYGWLIIGDLTDTGVVYAQVVKRNVFSIWFDDGE